MKVDSSAGGREGLLLRVCGVCGVGVHGVCGVCGVRGKGTLVIC